MASGKYESPLWPFREAYGYLLCILWQIWPSAAYWLGKPLGDFDLADLLTTEEYERLKKAFQTFSAAQ